MTYQELNKEVGNIDLFLLDQVLKGRYREGMKILDAGCGEGRNLIWFLKNDFDVYGLDQDPSAILMLQYLAKSLSGREVKERFIAADLAELPYLDHTFDAVISNAVLHFAESKLDFMKMFAEMIRTLKPKGSLFLRMCSSVGLPFEVEEVEDGVFLLPDESKRFLLSEQLLQELVGTYSLKYLEPIKTVNIDNQRLETTVLLEKQYD